MICRTYRYSRIIVKSDGIKNDIALVCLYNSILRSGNSCGYMRSIFYSELSTYRDVDVFSVCHLSYPRLTLNANLSIHVGNPALCWKKDA